MKSKLFYVAAFLAFGVVFSACKKNPPKPKTDEELQLEKLTGTWAVPSPAAANTVTIQSSDVTPDWASFTITFTDGNFTTSGPADLKVWPASGTWSFAQGDVSTIQRGDGIDINISVSETTLTMSFNYTDPGGRIDGVEGDWVFNDLVKQ